ncbi:Putative lipoprotein [hydrothermal vent metagenome]|uniref:Putative lipoprotein n=1 Tax=hydrothermal vent metagenome TaxID=652676 RepID=A0A1W1EL51_9ZZZZ
MKRVYILISMIILLLTSCSTNQVADETTEYVASSFVTSKIKAKLLATVGLEGFDISVKTYNNEIILTGVVNNGQQVALAGSVARSVKGARRVRNHIVVR